MKRKIPETTAKDTIEKLRAENRRLLKQIGLLRKELEEVKKLKPDQVTRSRQRQIEKEKAKCPLCDQGMVTEIKILNGMLYLCSVCDYRKINR